MNQMTPPEKTANIRSEARLHLMRLRQERLARKRAERPTAQLEPLTPTSPDADAPEETDNTLLETDGDSAPEPELEEAVADEGHAEGGSDSSAIEADAAPSPSEAGVEPNAGVAEEPCADGPQGSTPQGDVAPAEAAEDSELLRLPGSGPGLVWMLEKCGVHSMDDLATADPDRLKSDLGLVAKILDLDFWIDFARENRA